MRKYISLVESITNDLVWNYEIEERLSEMPKQDRAVFRDGLELIYDTGNTGIDEQGWVRHMHALWGYAPGELSDIFRDMVQHFSDLVKYLSNGRYAWTKLHTDDVPIDANDPSVQAVKASVEYTALAHQIMRACGTFHPGEIIRRFVAATGLPSGKAAPFIQHIIEASKASVKPVGDGTYEWVDAPKKTGLSFLRSLQGYQPPKSE